ncbi:MAG TPA: hypothetical protein DDW94_01755 [Deltaproteobacteria bacterium]|nr:hypothetical protein [Deltaproteobacteria bacterium]HCY12110.1 hypothetical protein [Deltaproteobacteria bacterium]
MLFLTLASPPVVSGGEASLSVHWQRPVKTGSYGAVEALYPESCAVCHRAQYDDWKGALHSKSIGPGLLAQLDPEKGPETALSCYYCHAPLVLQNEVISGGESGSTYFPNRSFDERLKSSGVGCAACHVREAGVLGPPGTKGVKGSPEANHASTRSDFFERAEFCAACHQLDEGYELNGKLLVNTFNEWKESEYGRNNIPCQGCHMPGRRHLFRGIHDPEMVKKGVKFEVERADAGSRIGAKLRITNSGVGHYFPTYVTPLVVVKGFLIDAKGKVLKGTVKETMIGRKVSLDLARELFDTRIPPFGSFEFDYDVRRPAKADRIVFEVWVFPDEFYNRFFENSLKMRDPAMKMEELKEALKTTSGSGYILFKREIFI